MMWAIKHKSGSVLFVTSDEFIADNRRKMGWIVEETMSKCPKCNDTGMADSGGVQPWGEPILIECDCVVEEVKMTSREQFEQQCRNGLVNGGLAVFENGVCVSELTRAVWSGWQASRAAIEIELPEPCSPGDFCVDTHAQANHEVVEAIESSGLKVKK